MKWEENQIFTFECEKVHFDQQIEMYTRLSQTWEQRGGANGGDIIEKPSEQSGHLTTDTDEGALGIRTQGEIF